MVGAGPSRAWTAGRLPRPLAAHAALAYLPRGSAPRAYWTHLGVAWSSTCGGGVHGGGGAREALCRPGLAVAYFRLAPALLNMEAIFGPIDLMSTIAAMETMTRIRPYSVNPLPP